jgi:hypothetical protein
VVVSLRPPPRSRLRRDRGVAKPAALDDHPQRWSALRLDVHPESRVACVALRGREALGMETNWARRTFARTEHTVEA